MYHKVDIISPTQWWVTAADFKRQIKQLVNRDFVFLGDYTDPDNQVVVTFDDGYENILTHAVPVLRRYRIPFEVFISEKYLGGWNAHDRSEPLTRYLDRSKLDRIVRHGGRIQWHTRDHKNLASLGFDDLVKQLSVPLYLRRKYPAPHLTWLSYPYGIVNSEIAGLAHHLFDGAVAIFSESPNDRWLLPRVPVQGFTSFDA